jgi:hypothetical protein
MRSKDRALHAPARLHSSAPASCHWFGPSALAEPCEAGAVFLSAHGRTRGPITTLVGPGATADAGTSYDT